MPAFTTSQDGVSASLNRYPLPYIRSTHTKFNYTHTHTHTQKERERESLGMTTTAKREKEVENERIKSTRTRRIYSVALSSSATGSKTVKLVPPSWVPASPSFTWSTHASSAGRGVLIHSFWKSRYVQSCNLMFF